MANLGRKLARQSKRSTPEGKEELKVEQEKKQNALPLQNQPAQNQKVAGHQPTTRMFQRRSGNS